MKRAQCIVAFQVFGLIVHLLLVIGLVALGFFDFLGIELLTNSSAKLLNALAVAQSSTGNVDSLSSRIATEMANVAPVLLSLMKAFSISALISFIAHLISFSRKRNN